jgi:hypothetical protein
MKRSKLLLLLLFYGFVISFFSFLSVLGIAMFQHFAHLRERPIPFWVEHGFPYTFFYETTFNDDGLHGFHPNQLMLDLIIHFLFYTLLFAGYKWLKNGTKKGL